MVEYDLAMVDTGVRFPLPAPKNKYDNDRTKL